MTISQLLQNLGRAENTGSRVFKSVSEQSGLANWDSKKGVKSGKFYRILRTIHHDIATHSCSPEQIKELLEHSQKLYQRYQDNGSILRSIFYRKRLRKAELEFQNLQKTLKLLESNVFPLAQIVVAKVKGKSSIVIRKVTQEQFNKYLQNWIKDPSPTKTFPYFPEIETLDLKTHGNLDFETIKKIAKHLPRLKNLHLPENRPLSNDEYYLLGRSSPLLANGDLSNIEKCTFPELGEFSSEEINEVIHLRPKLSRLDLSKTKIKEFTLDVHKLWKHQRLAAIIPPSTMTEFTIQAPRCHTLYNLAYPCRKLVSSPQLKKLNICLDGASSGKAQICLKELFQIEPSQSIVYLDLNNSDPVDLDFSLFPNLKFFKASLDSKSKTPANPGNKKPLQTALDKVQGYRALDDRYLSSEIDREIFAIHSSSYNSHLTNATLIGMVEKLNCEELNVQGSGNIDDFAFLDELEKPVTLFDKVKIFDLRGTSVTHLCYLKLKNRYPKATIKYDPLYLDRKHQARNSMPERLTDTQQIVLEYSRTGYLHNGVSFEALKEIYTNNDGSLTISQLNELKKQCILRMVSLIPYTNLAATYQFAKEHKIDYLIQETLIFHELYLQDRDPQLTKEFVQLLEDDSFAGRPEVSPVTPQSVPLPLLSVQSNLEIFLNPSSNFQMIKRTVKELLVKAKESGYLQLSTALVWFLLQGNHSKEQMIADAHDNYLEGLNAIIGMNDPILFAKVYKDFKSRDIPTLEKREIILKLKQMHPNLPWLSKITEQRKWASSLIQLSDTPIQNDALLDLKTLNVSAIDKVLQVQKGYPRLSLDLDLNFKQLKELAKSSDHTLLANVTYLDLSSSNYHFYQSEVEELLQWFPNLERINLPETHSYFYKNDKNVDKYKTSLWICLFNRPAMTETKVNNGFNLNSLRGNWLHVLALDNHHLQFVKPDNLIFHRETNLDDNKLAILAKNVETDHLDVTGCLKLTSQGIAHMIKMNKFKTIVLNECTNIGDEAFKLALKHGGLKHVKSLDLRKTLVTPQMVKKIKKAFPHLEDHILYDKSFLIQKSIANESVDAEVTLIGDDNQHVRIHLSAAQKLNPDFSKIGNVKIPGLNFTELKALKDYAYTGLFQMVNSASREKIGSYSGELLDNNVAANLKAEIEKEDIRTINRTNIENRLASKNPFVAAEAKEFKRLFIDQIFLTRVVINNPKLLNHLLNLDPEKVSQVVLDNLEFKGQGLLTDEVLYALAVGSRKPLVNIEDCPKISNDGVRSLLSLQAINTISLRNNPQIDDRALKNWENQFIDLKHVQVLDLRGTSVKSETVVKLLLQYPQLTIHFDETFLDNLDPKSVEDDVEIACIHKGVRTSIPSNLMVLKRLNPALNTKYISEELSEETVKFLQSYARTGYFPSLNFPIAKELYTYKGKLISEAVLKDIRHRITMYFTLNCSYYNIFEIYEFAKMSKNEMLLVTCYDFIDKFFTKESSLYKGLDETKKAIIDASRIEKFPPRELLDNTFTELQPFPYDGRLFSKNEFLLNRIPYFRTLKKYEEKSKSHYVDIEKLGISNLTMETMNHIFKYLQEGTLDFKFIPHLDSFRDIADYFMLPVLAIKIHRHLNPPKDEALYTSFSPTKPISPEIYEPILKNTP